MKRTMCKYVNRPAHLLEEWVRYVVHVRHNQEAIGAARRRMDQSGAHSVHRHHCAS